MKSNNVTSIIVDRYLSADGSVINEGSQIRLDGGVIASVGPVSGTEENSSEEVFRAEGYTALPGLIDTHLHLAMHNYRTFRNYRVGQSILPRAGQTLYSLFHAQLCFEMGFTTIRDMGLARTEGHLTAELCAVRDAIALGIAAGPRILTAGWAIMTGGHLDRILPRSLPRKEDEYGDGPYALRRLVRRQAHIGADFIKTCASGGFDSEGLEAEISNHTQEELDAIADEAHALNKLLAVHCFTSRSQIAAIKAGADTIEHCVKTDDAAIELILERDIPVVPTLAHRSDHAIELRREMGTPDYVLNGVKQLQPHCFETFQKMHKAGVRLAMGTDTGYDPGFGENSLELELYVQLGMTPLEAILTATHNAADTLRLPKIGRLKPGCAADIVLVKGNPFDDISLLRERSNIGLVMKGGEIFIDRISNLRREIIPPGLETIRKYDD